MTNEKTCGNCKDLFLGGNPPRMPLVVCKQTNYIVPHSFDGEEFVMWRVPLDCPRTSGVTKSEKQAPKKDWVIKTFSDFEV